MARVEVLDTDITTLDVDAIANAANTRLMHGGGVAGAISRAGGNAVREESLAAAPIGLGEAVETTGGDMPCRWVIHAATMELGGPTPQRDGHASSEHVEVRVLHLAEDAGVQHRGAGDGVHLQRGHVGPPHLQLHRYASFLRSVSREGCTRLGSPGILG